MRLHKANYLHLLLAGMDLAQSDREEMDRIEAGRDPVDVLTASSGDPTVRAITDASGNVLAVGGTRGGIIWFVHTNRAVALGITEKVRMLKLLAEYLIRVKWEALQESPHDYYHLTNIVSVENKPHVKLLSALGAEWDREPFPLNGHEFMQFYF